jgi:signal transduction histidine kinase
MNQLFYNLFSNALKFNEGPPQITISATIEEAVNVEALRNGEFQKYHCIRITDNGIGFDKKYAGTIFSVFSRVTADPKFKGTGIGLAICKKIIEIHRGTITVDSKKNIGSTFNVYLPVKNLK